jgi:hypothetical protein
MHDLLQFGGLVLLILLALIGGLFLITRLYIFSFARRIGEARRELGVLKSEIQRMKENAMATHAKAVSPTDESLRA